MHIKLLHEVYMNTGVSLICCRMSCKAYKFWNATSAMQRALQSVSMYVKPCLASHTNLHFLDTGVVYKHTFDLTGHLLAHFCCWNLSSCLFGAAQAQSLQVIIFMNIAGQKQ